MFDVTALGELLIDFTPNGKSETGSPVFTANPGGAPANFLAALSKCGKKTAFIGKVGKDAFGKLLKETIEKVNINSTGLIEDENYFTTLAFVSLSDSGDRSFSFARKPGADIMLRADELYLDALNSTKYFHFGTLSMTNEPSKTATEKAVETAKAAGALISFDPNYRAPLWEDTEKAKERISWGINHTDILKISDDEVTLLGETSFEDFSEKLLSNTNIKLIFITCGKKGCFFRNKNGYGFADAFLELKTIDTNGAGDIFGGSALSRVIDYNKSPELLSTEEMKEICTFASAMAGLSTTKHGAIPSIPSKEDAFKLYK